MSFYTFFVNLYNQFLALFPPPLQWLITLLVVIGLVVAFVGLIRYNWLFLILLILLLPFIFPILQRLFADLFAFFLYLLSLLGIGTAAG
ncbi:MAG TPA: hypothetical protein VK963_00475 [Candidatus Saccharimonadales bacterium]|nr:hypothetical protein [Candidatus Saccharimonadales bacterium]